MELNLYHYILISHRPYPYPVWTAHQLTRDIFEDWHDEPELVQQADSLSYRLLSAVSQQNSCTGGWAYPVVENCEVIRGDLRKWLKSQGKKWKISDQELHNNSIWSCLVAYTCWLDIPEGVQLYSSFMQAESREHVRQRLLMQGRGARPSTSPPIKQGSARALSEPNIRQTSLPELSDWLAQCGIEIIDIEPNS